MRAVDFLEAPEESLNPRPGPAVRTRPAEFLDAPSERSASAFLDAPDVGPLSRAADALDAKADEIQQQSAQQWAALDPAAQPTPEEVAAASRPARITLTRGGQPVLQPNGAPPPPMPPAVAPSAEWGEVVSSLPAQFVAGARSAAANLRRMAAEGRVAEREEGLGLAQAAQRWGAVIDPDAVARQEQRVAEARASRERAEAEAAQARADVRLMTPKDQTVAQQALSSLAQSAGPTLLGLAAGILTRNVPLAMTIAGGGGAAQQAGSTYGEARERGASHQQASVAAVIDGTLEGLGEALPIGFVLRPGTPIYMRIIGTISRESGQETATQLAQDLRALAMENPDLTFNEVWRNMKVAALAGAGGGAVYGGAGAAVNASRPRAASTAAGDSQGGGAPAQDAVAAGPAAGLGAEPATGWQAQSAEQDMQSPAPASAAQSGPPVRALPAQFSAAGFLDAIDQPAGAPVLDEGELARPLGSEAESETTEDTGSREQLAQALTEADVRAADVQLEPERRAAAAAGPSTAGEGARPTLASDLGAQATWLEQRAREAGFASADDMAAKDPAAFDRLAIEWREAHPREVAGEQLFLRAPGAPESRAEVSKDVVVFAKRAEEGERAAAGIVMTPPYTGAAEEAVADAHRARPDAIRQAIRDLFRVPLNEGGFKGSRDKLGIYKVKARTIRVRNQNDIAVISHELGHHISEISQPIREARKAFDAELRRITPYAAQQKTAALQREEGMAEFFRLYLTEPAQAQAKAPGFFRAFDKYVEEHGFKSAVDEIAGAIQDWQNLPPADRILAKVGEAEPEFRKRWNLDRIIFEVFDNWLPMRRMVEDLKPDVAPSADPFKLAHLLSGDAAIIEDWLLRETIPFDFTRRANPKDRGKPLAEILKPIENQQREFGAYLIAKRANELMMRGKEHLYSKDEIAAGLRLETPEFNAAAEAIYRYQDELLQYAVEGGLVSEYVADKFRQFPFYVPFFRVGEPIGRRAANIFKEIRGGTENLRDPIANIIENTVRIIHATNRNYVLAKAHELARSVPGGGRWLEDVPMPERAVKLETQKVIDQLREQGIEVDTSTAEAIASTQTFFVKNPFGDERERIIVVRRQGRPYALQVNDEMLWHALERFEPVDMGLVEKVLSVPADILRAGIVLSPEFMARNFARDTLSGFLQSKKGLIPVASTIDGFKEIATRSDVARLYRAFGGAFGDLWRADRGFERKLVERMARHGGFDPRTILTPRGLISLLHRLGSVAEAGTRVAEFKRTAKEGDVDSLIEAAYNAREVSVDFGMHGHSRSVRFLTRITVFLNPALQGWYKAARTSRSAPFTTLLRGGMLAAASILLFLNNRDEDWYDEIEQWEKNVYWHLDIGLRDKQGQVIPLRIPKPFEWGGIFGSIPEALAEVAIEQHGKKFAKRLASIVDDVFTFRVIPSALLLPAELWANKNQFTGRPIVPESKERLAPELQATPGTSLTARKVGELTDTSPAKIDHAVRGFFGTLGTYTVMLADQALRLGGAEPQALPIPWARYPVVRAFFRDPSGANSRYVNEFYELLREARRAEASLKYMTPERMAEYEAEHRQAIEQRRSAEKVSRWMAQLRRENEQLRHDRDLPAEERQRMIAENNQQIRWFARDFMREIEAGKAAERARSMRKPESASTPAGDAPRA
jgi:hypothetical protein